MLVIRSGVGLYRIDGIEPAAHAHLEYRCVDIAGLEHGHCGKRAVLEIGQRHIAAYGLNALECSDYAAIARRLPINADSLVIAQDMRRHVGTDSARRQQQAAQHCSARSLAIRTGYMDDAATELE